MKILIALTIAIVASGFKEINRNQYFIMSTSKFWYNLRQGVNVLMIYKSLRENGVSDQDIVLMIPENTACNSKNNYPGVVCPHDESSYPNLYRNVEVDYKGNDVSIQNWVNIWRGKYDKYTPQSRRLKMTGDRSFISYATGHGGDGYMKMQDTTYLLDFEMAKLTREMQFLKNYKEGLFFTDSCGSITLYEKIDAENITILGSSSLGEKSYSNGRDPFLLLPKTDRFSYRFYKWLDHEYKLNPKISLADLSNVMDVTYLDGHSKIVNNFVPPKNETQIMMRDFFTQRQGNPYVVYGNNYEVIGTKNLQDRLLESIKRVQRKPLQKLNLQRQPSNQRQSESNVFYV